MVVKNSGMRKKKHLSEKSLSLFSPQLGFCITKYWFSARKLNKCHKYSIQNTIIMRRKYSIFESKDVQQELIKFLIS